MWLLLLCLLLLSAVGTVNRCRFASVRAPVVCPPFLTEGLLIGLTEHALTWVIDEVHKAYVCSEADAPAVPVAVAGDDDDEDEQNNFMSTYPQYWKSARQPS